VTNTENGEQVYRLIESLYTHVTDLFTEQNLMMQNMAKDLRVEMADMKEELRAEMADMKVELRSEMANMKAELRSEMADMKAELKEAIVKNGKAILRLEDKVTKIGETVVRHDLDIQMLKKTFVQTG
jgi:predicted phage gp36 major capsid-like protein